MNTETLKAIEKALENNNLDDLFTQAIGETPEDTEKDEEFALMFNVDTDELFFLEYAVKGNGWAKTAEQQNPWICIGYIDANEIIMGSPESRVIETIEYELGQIKDYEESQNQY